MVTPREVARAGRPKVQVHLTVRPQHVPPAMEENWTPLRGLIAIHVLENCHDAIWKNN